MDSSRKLLLCCILMVSTGDVQAFANEFSNTLGWEWRVAPHEPASFMASHGYLVISETGVGHQFNVTLARPVRGDSHGTQVVAFDEQRHRFRLIPRQGGGQQGVSMQRWILPPEDLKASDVAYVGIEVLTRRSVERATKEALSAAKKAGIEVLPFPIVNEPYEFRVTDSKGKRLATADFSGNVLVIDCWATWCTPCVARLPVLKELESRHAESGFRIVGVNFDESLAAAEKVQEKLGLRWPAVYVSSDDETRDTWHAVNGIMALPRILVVDKQGILRADFEEFNDQQLERLIVRLLEAPE